MNIRGIGGVHASWGCMFPGGMCASQRCMLPGGGGGLCFLGGRGGGGIPACTEDRITDTSKNITLATTSLRPVITRC